MAGLKGFFAEQIISTKQAKRKRELDEELQEGLEELKGTLRQKGPKPLKSRKLKVSGARGAREILGII